jgi:hypothetical protein
MQRSFVYRGSRDYTVRGRDPGGPDFVNTYLVFEFVPKPGTVAVSIPGMKLPQGSESPIRR